MEFRNAALCITGLPVKPGEQYLVVVLVFAKVWRHCHLNAVVGQMRCDLAQVIEIIFLCQRSKVKGQNMIA